MKEIGRDILAENKDLRKQPYSVPEGYFDTFKSQMKPYEKQQVTLAARLAPYISIAAVFVFLVTAGTLFLKKSTPYDDLTQEDFLVFSRAMANTEYYEMDQIADAKADLHKAGDKIKAAGAHIEKDVKCCDGKGKCDKK